MAIRLIIYTDSRKQSDVNTFQNAGNALKKSYQLKYSQSKDEIKIVFVKDGKEIAQAINKVPKGALLSLDIISHGNQGGIHISRNLLKPLKSGFIKRNAHVTIRRSSDRPQTSIDAEYMEESMHGLYSDYMSKLGVSYYYNQTYESSLNIATLDDLDFGVFAENSIVEFHGCRTGEIIPVLNTYLKDNFAKNFSDRLGNKSMVIGHLTNSAPNKNPNGNSNDYRYGRVRVYKNGTLVKDGVERWGLKVPNSSTP